MLQKSPKFEVVYSKMDFLRTMVIVDFRSRAQR